MNTQKVVKKLNELAIFNKIVIEGNKKVTAHFKDSINDRVLKSLVDKFDFRKYDYEIKLEQGKMVFEIKDFAMPSFADFASQYLRNPNPFLNQRIGSRPEIFRY